MQRCDDAGLEIGFFQAAQIHLPTPIHELFCRSSELRLGGFFKEHLARLEKTKQFIAHGNRHARIAEPRKTFDRARPGPGRIGNLLLCFQARGAGAVVLGHERAKRVLRFFALLWDLPGFERAQGQRQSRGLGERVLVVPVYLRAVELLYELFVSLSFHTERLRDDPVFKQEAKNVDDSTTVVESIPVTAHRLLTDMKSSNPAPAIFETLVASPFLDQMEARHLKIMAESAMQSSFDAGESVFREGDVANRFYLIQEGSVALESRSRGRDPIHIQTIGEGDVLGWSWLFPPYLWHFDARAIDPVKVVFIYGSRLREHCEEDHEFGYELVKRMSEVMMRRLQATRWQLFEISDLALRSQWEALQLTAQLGLSAKSGAKHSRTRHASVLLKSQPPQKK